MSQEERKLSLYVWTLGEDWTGAAAIAVAESEAAARNLIRRAWNQERPKGSEKAWDRTMLVDADEFERDLAKPPKVATGPAGMILVAGPVR